MEDTVANLDRLSQKPGVRATLVLSRRTGDIVQSSGLESQRIAEDASSSITARDNDIDGDDSVRSAKLKSVEKVARLVFEYVKSSAALAQQLNGTQDDELKLLRMRTRRNEFVIVPDARYIAVVIHDTPPA
ncbi:hypothetical protein K461DRAFT_231573 [Myriangium duriaei CBS 260.36]|uniref:Roadblock/LAMTOR2 domain-containing protein n=1 Tax=Myriangium duriaei CBS 260.36 TaxID=1168546 RepID=A0A9P4IXE6_9PEZI|nr:hypothetical protein K461DRAFT_231573 [Myriangium duriaei CBS 260.36]